jgi:hypothetical protein
MIAPRRVMAKVLARSDVQAYAGVLNRPFGVDPTKGNPCLTTSCS